MSLPCVILKAKRAQPFYARHPWVFAGAVDRIEGNPADGDEVELRSQANHFIAKGLFNSQSKIRVRLYSWQEDQKLDEGFWGQKLEEAISFREAMGLRGPELGCRLVFSEADGLSGLSIDEYAGYLAVQITALGIGLRRQMLLEYLVKRLEPRGIYFRTEKGVGDLEGLQIQDELVYGVAPPIDHFIREGSLKLFLNLAEGQKTGYYLDQRENRQAAAKYCRGKSVLDAFSYTGGFGLHAAVQGAKSVECVDISQAALDLAKRNVEANGLENFTFVKQDVFRYLTEQVEKQRRFEVVMLDPPKFARSRSAVGEALKGYRRLYTMGVRLLERGGILVVSCCSGLIVLNDLIELIAQVAAQEKRDIQILEQRGAAPDHPTSAACLETTYLKCLICRVK
jgi:23S rRNA (cytosine1962-C5)-methyltransferase